MTFNRTIIKVCICFLALANAQCGGDNRRSQTDSRTLTIHVANGDERVLGPAWDIYAKFLMFLPLAGWDEGGERIPRLAKSWEHSDDYRTWTFRLRPDVKWHDGAPVTAHDVAFTFDLLSHRDVALRNPTGRTVEVIDDTTYTITYHRAPSTDVPDRWMVYYPKHLLEELDPADFAEWDFWTHPVGNGPYRYVRHVRNTMIELEANPDYYAGKPSIDRVVLQFGSSKSLVELLSGNVDIITMDRVELPTVADDARFTIHHDMWPGAGALVGIFWNHGDPRFEDARVRRALTMAIDRVELYRMQALPETFPVLDVVYTERQYLRGALPAPMPHDQAQARSLLDQSGWRDTDGDGIRKRGDVIFEFTALVGSPELARVAVYVQSQFREIGVRMEIQTLGGGIRGRLREGDFQAAFGRFEPFQPGDIEWLNGRVAIQYENPRVRALIDAAHETMDPAVQDSLYEVLMPIIAAEQPVTILFPGVTTYVAHRRVRGLHGPYRANPFLFAEFLWLEEQLQ